MPSHQIRVAAGRHERVNTPISWPCPPDMESMGHLALQCADGQTLPVQMAHAGAEVTLHAVVPHLAPGEEQTYSLAQERGLQSRQGVDVREVPQGMNISIDGKPLTSYVARAEGIARPYCYPLYGPGGVMLTRRFPMERDIPGETSDHPHHRSLYVAYGEVNGVDNWSEGAGHGYTRHKGFEAIVTGSVLGSFRAVGLWTSAAGASLLTERRDMTFYSQPDTGRAIDLTVEWTADDESVTFGDTKEGGIVALRVASSMDGDRGGVLENAHGGIGQAETWGRRAEWCDYSGNVEGNIVGIAIFDHPDNFRAPTYWHARDYGLLTTNVFGGEAFTGDPKRNGTFVLAPGDSLRFRYRIFIHAGNATTARLKDRYHDFINPPTIRAL